jgi:acyl-CoA thioesterase II
MSPDRFAPPDLDAWWAEILDVRPSGEDVFTAPPSPPVFARVYGGHLAAQCLLAAAGTVAPGRDPHSAHTAVRRGGDIRKPIDYRVTRVRDSRSLSTRLVLAEQDGRTLASATASFQVPGEVFDHGGGPPAPAPAPDTLTGRSASLRDRFGEDLPPGAPAVLPMDMRYVDRVPWDLPEGGAEPRNRVWTRAASRLPADAVSQAAALLYLTDYPMFEPALFPLDQEWATMMSGRGVYGSSLDHAVWFHRPTRADGWLLLELVAPIAARSRALGRAEVFAPGTGLVATVVQEMTFVRT